MQEQDHEPVTASIIVPTRRRAGYLDVALASIAPQARALGAEVIVVDDGPDEATRATAGRHAARYVANDGAHGLNRARNLGLTAAGGELIVLVDDDVEAHPGWLAALLAAPASAGVLAGRILGRIEDHPLRACGREGPPVTFLDLGDADRDADRAYGANMAIRRPALEALGPFDEAWATGAGDEEEWVRRHLAAGGRVRYVAGAAVDHRRAGDDARLRSLARANFARGRSARRFDVAGTRQPGLGREAAVLAGCLAHAVRHRCANGLLLAATAAGRLREAAMPQPPPPAEDFLVGRSGEVGGKRGTLRLVADRMLDVLAVASGRRARLRRAAARHDRRRVLVVGVHQAEGPTTTTAMKAELGRSQHDVVVDIRPAGTGGKYENANRILAAHALAAFDWIVVLDDDVAVPRGFLDNLVFLAERHGLAMAQPAQSLASHAAWPIVRRRPGSAVRRTNFVEIGPITAFSREAAAELLPFPELRQAWGLDLHWAAVARDRGWAVGILDALPVRHEMRRIGVTYPREAAVAEARAFLAGRPYLPRDEVRTLSVHRSW